MAVHRMVRHLKYISLYPCLASRRDTDQDPSIKWASLRAPPVPTLSLGERVGWHNHPPVASFALSLTAWSRFNQTPVVNTCGAPFHSFPPPTPKENAKNMRAARAQPCSRLKEPPAAEFRPRRINSSAPIRQLKPIHQAGTNGQQRPLASACGYAKIERVHFMQAMTQHAVDETAPSMTSLLTPHHGTHTFPVVVDNQRHQRRECKKVPSPPPPPPRLCPLTPVCRPPRCCSQKHSQPRHSLDVPSLIPLALVPRGVLARLGR